MNFERKRVAVALASAFGVGSVMLAGVAEAQDVRVNVTGSNIKRLEAEGALPVQTLTKDLAKQFDVDEGDGVVVTDVADSSIAEQKGLQRGDVITEVDRAPLHSAEEFKAAMLKADAKKGVLVFVKRNGASTFVVLKEK